MCERWINSFESFVRDMGIPEEGQTIERVNNDGNYEPGNCVWATMREQILNRRNSRAEWVGGRKVSVEAYSKEMDVPYTKVRFQIERYGMSLDDAVNYLLEKKDILDRLDQKYSRKKL